MESKYRIEGFGRPLEQAVSSDAVNAFMWRVPERK